MNAMIEPVISTFKKSFSSRILFSNIFFVILPLLIVVFVANNKIRQLSRDEFRKISHETLQHINHNIENYLSVMESLTFSIVVDKDVQTFLKAPENEEELKKINNLDDVKTAITKSFFWVYSHHEFSIILAGLNNEIFYSRDYGLNRDFDLIDNDYVNRLTKSDKPFVFVAPHRPEYVFNDKIVFSVIREIKDIASGKLIGYLYLDMSTELFDFLIDRAAPSDNSYIFIFSDNKVIYDHSYALSSLIDDALYIEFDNANEQTNFTKSTNNDYYYTFNTIKNTGWKIAYFHSIETYNQEAINITRYIIIISSIIILVSFFISYVHSRAISKPIKELSHAMQSIEESDFQSFVKLKGNDEIASLGKVFNHMIERIRNLIKNVYVSNLAEKDATIYALQSQINPHFLYNTLQTISDIAESEEVHEISTACESLASMFRYSIESKHRLVRLYDEINNIENYFSLQTIKHKHKLEYTIEVPGELMGISIPRFIIQPIVENAISHGITPLQGVGKISIRAEIVNDILHIFIEDNGIGINQQKLQNLTESLRNAAIDFGYRNSEYLALKNVNNRLILRYGSEYGLEIMKALNRGTIVMIRIPIISQDRLHLAHSRTDGNS